MNPVSFGKIINKVHIDQQSMPPKEFDRYRSNIIHSHEKEITDEKNYIAQLVNPSSPSRPETPGESIHSQPDTPKDGSGSQPETPRNVHGFKPSTFKAEIVPDWAIYFEEQNNARKPAGSQLNGTGIKKSRISESHENEQPSGWFSSFGNAFRKATNWVCSLFWKQ